MNRTGQAAHRGANHRIYSASAHICGCPVAYISFIDNEEPLEPIGCQRRIARRACTHARSTQTNYETLLPVHHAPRVDDVLLNTAKVIFQTHGLF
jgi:hypothetical protein